MLSGADEEDEVSVAMEGKEEEPAQSGSVSSDTGKLRTK